MAMGKDQWERIMEGARKGETRGEKLNEQNPVINYGTNPAATSGDGDDITAHTLDQLTDAARANTGEPEVAETLMEANRIGSIILYVEDDKALIAQGKSALEAAGRTVYSLYDHGSPTQDTIGSSMYWAAVFGGIKERYGQTATVTVLLDLNLRGVHSGYDVLQILAENKEADPLSPLESVVVVSSMTSSIKVPNAELDMSSPVLPVYADTKRDSNYAAGLVETLNRIENGQLEPRNL